MLLVIFPKRTILFNVQVHHYYCWSGSLQTGVGSVHPRLVQRGRSSLQRHHALHEKSWPCHFRGGALLLMLFWCNLALLLCTLSFSQIYGMTENPNNNANYFNPAQSHGRRSTHWSLIPIMIMLLSKVMIIIITVICGNEEGSIGGDPDEIHNHDHDLGQHHKLRSWILTPDQGPRRSIIMILTRTTIPILTTIMMTRIMSRIQQGSVGRSAPGCQTKLHLQDPADGVGEVIINIIFILLSVLVMYMRQTKHILINVIRMITMMIMLLLIRM